MNPTLLAAGVGAVACLLLGFLWEKERVTSANLRTQIEQLHTAATAGQNTALKNDVVEVGKALNFATDTGKIADQAGGAVTKSDSAAEAHFNQEANHANAIADGGDFDVLLFADNSLRATATQILSARDVDQDGVPGVPDPRVGDNAAPRSRPRAFANYALDWGRFGQQCAGRLVEIARFKRQYDARVAAQNNK